MGHYLFFKKRSQINHSQHRRFKAAAVGCATLPTTLILRQVSYCKPCEILKASRGGSAQHGMVASVHHSSPDMNGLLEYKRAIKLGWFRGTPVFLETAISQAFFFINITWEYHGWQQTYHDSWVAEHGFCVGAIANGQRERRNIPVLAPL